MAAPNTGGTTSRLIADLRGDAWLVGGSVVVDSDRLPDNEAAALSALDPAIDYPGCIGHPCCYMRRPPKVLAKKRVFRGRVVAARLTPEESAAFDALLALEEEKGNPTISGSWLIRMLVRKEARRRKLLD